MKKVLRELFNELFKFGLNTTIRCLSWGLVTFKMYAWFIIPVFTFMPQIQYTQAIGISMFLALFGKKLNFPLKEEYYECNKNTRLVVGHAAPFMLLLLAWITHLITG